MFARSWIVVPFLLLVTTAADAQLRYTVRGVDGDMRDNVLAHVDTVQLGRQVRAAARDDDELVANAIRRTYVALRPFGYYRPTVRAEVRRDGDRPELRIDVDPGAPVRVVAADIAVSGAGATLGELRDWKSDWPLTPGSVLDQRVWEEQKRIAEEATSNWGFFDAAFTVQELAIDLERNEARLTLHLETGERYVMGSVDFGEHVLKPGILEYVPRFNAGDPYSAALVDHLRIDLWKTGYFTDVSVEERRVGDTTPGRVDFRVELATTTRDYFQGAIGFGTDTGMRLQAQWNRRPMSPSGDRIDIGIGWQEVNDEFAVKTTYRRPRPQRNNEFWVSDLVVKFDNQDLDFKRRDEDQDFIRLANGDVDEQHLRLGRLKVRNARAGNRQWFQTAFVQLLNSRRKYRLVDSTPEKEALFSMPPQSGLLASTDQALSVGFDFDLVAVSGKGFDTVGRRERAVLFHSNEAFGSDDDFTQLYLSSHRSYRYGERWKLLLRAEAAYTRAEVDDVVVDIDGEPLELSVTRLPNFYRFKAGGSGSVRGYAFEQLSNNNVGSNHLLAASAEIEAKVLENWSVAVFADIGNAFNDWSDTQLKLGLGVGVRWYSIAGPIRVDFGRAMDFVDRPWRIHFTIGTPLL